MVVYFNDNGLKPFNKKSLPVCNSLTHDFLQVLASTCTRVMIKCTLGQKNKNLIFNVGSVTLWGNGI